MGGGELALWERVEAAAGSGSQEAGLFLVGRGKRSADV